jgi:hypothetical protein
MVQFEQLLPRQTVPGSAVSQSAVVLQFAGAPQVADVPEPMQTPPSGQGALPEQ